MGFRTRRRDGLSAIDQDGPSLEARRATRESPLDLNAPPSWEIRGVEEESAIETLPASRLAGGGGATARAAEPSRRDAFREDPRFQEARERVRARPAPPPHLLSQTNRGLRMILTTTVLVVLVSWGATVAQQYISYLKIQELSRIDPDAMRVMCAVQPPREQDIGMMHLCELAAKTKPATTAPVSAASAKSGAAKTGAKP